MTWLKNDGMGVNRFEQLKGSVCDQTPHDCQQPPFSPIMKRGLDGFIQADNK